MLTKHCGHNNSQSSSVIIVIVKVFTLLLKLLHELFHNSC